jgi:hypothetical protein
MGLRAEARSANGALLRPPHPDPALATTRTDRETADDESGAASIRLTVGPVVRSTTNHYTRIAAEAAASKIEARKPKGYERLGIEQIDVPTTKDDLIKWLNKNARNG